MTYTNCGCASFFLSDEADRRFVGPAAEAKAKGGVERAGRGDVESVEVKQLVGGDAVEGQSSCGNVHKHPDSFGDGEAVWRPDHRLFFVVPEWVILLCTHEAPALVVPAQPAVCTPPLPAQLFVGHGNNDAAAPHHFPVRAFAQSIFSQQLPAAVVEPVRVVRVRLLLPHHSHRLEVIRQMQVPVGCVRIQFQWKAVWLVGEVCMRGLMIKILNHNWWSSNSI